MCYRYKQHHIDHKDESGNSDAQRNCRDLLSKVHNSLQRDVELSFQSVMAAMAGFPERYRSHTYHNLIMAPFLQMLAETDDTADSIGQHSGAAGASGDSFFISNVNGQKTLSNQRMDYMLRPAALDNCSLYDFVGCWDKQAWGKHRTYMEWTQEEIEKCMDTPFEIPNKASPSDQFRFLPSHHQNETHGLAFRTDHAQHVVVIKGPTFPSRETDPSRFAQMILLLFKPFRDIKQLRGSHSWLTALEQFESTTSARVRFYIQNIEELKNRQTAWEEDVVVRAKNANISTTNDQDSDADESSERQFTQACLESDSDGEGTDEERQKNSLVWIAPSGKSSDKLTQAYLVAQQKELFLSNATECITAEPPKNERDHKGLPSCVDANQTDCC